MSAPNVKAIIDRADRQAAVDRRMERLALGKFEGDAEAERLALLEEQKKIFDEEDAFASQKGA